MNSLEKQILYLMENLKRQVRIQPLNLGSTYYSSVSGGSGGPPGGIIGYLPQGRVTYDITEAEKLLPTYPPPSGVKLSLIDNLNHIRYRLGLIEDYGGLLPTTTSGVVGMDGRRIDYYVVNAPTSGFFTTLSYMPNSLKISWNGLNQFNTEFQATNPILGHFNTLNVIPSGSTVIADYWTYTTSGIVFTAGGGGGLGEILVQDNGTPVGSGITTLNFGANLDVTLNGETVTISGGGGGAIAVHENSTPVASGIATLNFTKGLEANETATDYITLAINQNKIIRRKHSWGDPPYEDTYYEPTEAGFLQAIDDASYHPGADGYLSTIYLPPCQISISSQLTIPEYTRIIGVGENYYGAENYTHLDFADDTIIDGYVALKDLHLDYYKNTDAEIHLFEFSGSYNFLFLENCSILCRNPNSGSSAYNYIAYSDYGNCRFIARNTKIRTQTSSSNAPYLCYTSVSNGIEYELINCYYYGTDSDFEISNTTDQSIYKEVYNFGWRYIEPHVLNKNVGLVVESGISRLGNYGEGNYTEIDTSGHITLYGEATVFDDLQTALVGQHLESPGSDITQNSSEGSLTFADTAVLSDYVTMNVQMSHGWKIGSTIYPHIHWWQTSSDVPNWLLQYRWQRNSYPKVTTWSGIAYSGMAFSYTSGTLNQITGFGSGIVPPVDAALSDILQVRLLRDTTNASTLFGGTDPLTGDSDVVNLDIHIEKDSIGSDEPYVK